MHQGTEREQDKKSENSTEIAHFRQSPWSECWTQHKGMRLSRDFPYQQQQTVASCSTVFLAEDASPALSWNRETKNVFGANKTLE